MSHPRENARSGRGLRAVEPLGVHEEHGHSRAARVWPSAAGQMADDESLRKRYLVRCGQLVKGEAP